MIINELKKDIATMAYRSGQGHIASSFSIVDILWTLYDKVLKYDSSDPDWNDRDRFILSKGHGSFALYAVLASKGLIDKADLHSLCQFNSRYGAHPDRTKIPFVEATTGSLGHGAPISVGIAMALKIQKNPARVFCLVGDGECNEGTIWESALLASHHKLDNLYWIIDYNHSTDRALMMGDLVGKFSSFGWLGRSTYDGHDCNNFLSSLDFSNEFVIAFKPKCIVTNTIKGNGVSFMTNNPEWHHKTPTEDEYFKIMEELEVTK